MLTDWSGKVLLITTSFGCSLFGYLSGVSLFEVVQSIIGYAEVFDGGFKVILFGDW